MIRDCWLISEDYLKILEGVAAAAKSVVNDYATIRSEGVRLLEAELKKLDKAARKQEEIDRGFRNQD